MERLFGRLLEFTRDGVYRYTLDGGRVVMANRGLTGILELELEPEELVGRPLSDLLVYTEKEGTVRERLVTSGEIHGYEYHFRTLKGTDKWVIHDSFIVDDPIHGRVVEAIVRDITERKRAERLLADERELLEVTLRSISDAVIATDRDGKVTLVNSAAEQLCGWPQAEAAGRPLAEVFRIENEFSRQPCADPVRQVLETGQMVGLANHTLLISRDGTERIISDAAAPIKGAAGVLGVVLVFRDDTRQRLLEREMIKAQKLESVGILAGGIAHDFNNILMAIGGNIQLARLKGPDRGPVAGFLREAENAVGHARSLTQQLLALSRGGSPQRTTVSIADLAGETLRFALRGSKVALELDLSVDLWPVEADAGQLSQVLHNIAINADQAMPDGGGLRVVAANAVVEHGSAVPLRPGRYVRLSLADTGVGILREHLGRVFDPYFTTKERGSGLGLAVCYAIVRNHGGTITADSRPGHGAVFTIWLPAAPGGVAPRRSSDELPGPGRGRVLVMDDEPAVLGVIQQMAGQAGYQAETAMSGQEAIERFERAREKGRPFDVVVLDLTMPGGIGGAEVVGRLRSIDPGVRAVVSSGYATDPVIVRHREHGFDGVLHKPFTLTDLARTLGEAVADRGGQANRR